LQRKKKKKREHEEEKEVQTQWIEQSLAEKAKKIFSFDRVWAPEDEGREKENIHRKSSERKQRFKQKAKRGQDKNNELKSN
jgi:type IV secretory pathway VirB10-like protein